MIKNNLSPERNDIENEFNCSNKSTKESFNNEDENLFFQNSKNKEKEENLLLQKKITDQKIEIETKDKKINYLNNKIKNLSKKISKYKKINNIK